MQVWIVIPLRVLHHRLARRFLPRPLPATSPTRAPREEGSHMTSATEHPIGSPDVRANRRSAAASAQPFGMRHPDPARPAPVAARRRGERSGVDREPAGTAGRAGTRSHQLRRTHPHADALRPAGQRSVAGAALPGEGVRATSIPCSAAFRTWTRRKCWFTTCGLGVKPSTTVTVKQIQESGTMHISFANR